MTSNKLKIIAVIAMIIDHFGYYFNYFLGDEIYIICRVIGRIAMPIFTYLIIEGYFHTKKLSKYIKRISILAVITQIIIFGLDYFAKDKSYYIADTFNILFSFVFLLVLIAVFELLLKKKKMRYKILFVLYMLFVIIIYNFVEFDYGFITLILGVGIYLIRKYISNIYIQKVLLALLHITVFLVLGSIYTFGILSIIPILLYNGQRGKNTNSIKYTFYYIFPIQHLLLYGLYVLFI